MLLSIVIPVYNEAEGLPYLVDALRRVLSTMECDYEVLFVDDGSRDGSRHVLEQHSHQDPRLKVIGFSRNFGHQAALTAGLDFASGDAVVVMDADLQDPPELLPEMVALYHQGYDVVSAQRVSREGDSWFKRVTAKAFYRLMRGMVDERLLEEVGDFRLFSRAALTALRGLRERHRFLRGMVAWLGLKEAVVPFHRRARVAGTTKYPLWKMLRFAWTAISSFSALPLRLSLPAGGLVTAGGLAYLGYAMYRDLVAKATVPGWTSLVALQIVFSGALLMAIGLLGDYVARIYEEVKCRPLYVVSETSNLKHPMRGVEGVVVLPVRELDAAPDAAAPRARVAAP